MSKISKLAGKEGERWKDLLEEQQIEQTQIFVNALQTGEKELAKSVKEISEHQAKKSAQPFITNNLLENIIESQTPKWVNYLILGLTGIGVIIGIIALLHGYGFI